MYSQISSYSSSMSNAHPCALQTGFVLIKLRIRNTAIPPPPSPKCISSLPRSCPLTKTSTPAFVIKAFLMCRFPSAIIIRYWFGKGLLSRPSVLVKMTGYDECKLSCGSSLDLSSFPDCCTTRAMFDGLFAKVSHQILKARSLNIFTLNQASVTLCVSGRPGGKEPREFLLI